MDIIIQFPTPACRDQRDLARDDEAFERAEAVLPYDRPAAIAAMMQLALAGRTEIGRTAAAVWLRGTCDVQMAFS